MRAQLTEAAATVRSRAGGTRLAALRADPLGVLIGGLLGVAVVALPFVIARPNRIAAGEAADLLAALPGPVAIGLALVLALTAATAMVRSPASVRLATAIAASLILLTAAGFAADHLSPADNRYARVSVASGFWVALFALGLLAADAVVRLTLQPLARVGLLAAVAALFAALLSAGALDQLSILKEYEVRADVFWREAGVHVALALGSLAAAVATGVPLGILIARNAALRGPVLGVLNVFQTIPSIALFGMLIAPLGWLAANVPAAAALGIKGIGMAPAFVALFLYSLLPMVANTAVGLAGVPPATVEAARGMGMTSRQRLLQVEMPLALPVILTGIRIVLVQNIGLATVAALIGGGGFGVFVFQGIGQTATDLILLGTLPTVALAFASAVVLDAVVDASRRGRP